MGGEEYREIKQSISRVEKRSKVIGRTCFTIAALFTAFWLILVVALINNLTSSFNEGDLEFFLYVIFHGLTVGLLFLVGGKIFSSIAAGESPFTMKQVKRFRTAAAILLFFSVFEAVLSLGVSCSAFVVGINVNASAEVDIDLMPLFFSLILYGVSVMVRYGVLLQRLSDETV